MTGPATSAWPRVIPGCCDRPRSRVRHPQERGGGERHVSEPMLTIRSRHPAACGIPPALSTEAADLYIGYFATSRTGTGSSGSSRAIARRSEVADVEIGGLGA